MMGGVDITATSVDQYNITISNVTGDIIITANAQVLVLETYTESQGYVSAGTGQLITNNYYTSCDYVDISCFRSTGVKVEFSVDVLKFTTYAVYDENKTFIKGGQLSTGSIDKIFTLSSDYLSGVTYIRISVTWEVLDEHIESNSNHRIIFTPLS